MIFGGNYYKWFLFLQQTRAVDAESTKELPKKSLKTLWGSIKNSQS